MDFFNLTFLSVAGDNGIALGRENVILANPNEDEGSLSPFHSPLINFCSQCLQVPT